MLGALFDAMAAAFCVNHEIASKIIRVNTTVDIDGNFTTGSMIVEYSEINSDHDVFYGQEKQNKNLTNVIVEFDHDKYMELIYRVFKYYDHKEL